MSEQYLWDGTGPPDPEVQHLEQLLSVYREGPRRPRLAYLAIAASVLIAAGLWFGWQPGSSEWRIGTQSLHRGETVESGPGAVKLESAATGMVNLEPNSRLKVLNNRRLALNRGRMHAFIWAPPERFQVETPSANAIDLGCDYTLSVEQDGSGLLTVLTGWVAFQAGKNESFIPAGAACRTNKATGPGLPYFTDAAPALQSAVESLDVDRIIMNSRPRDALTLWHLIIRTEGSDRRRAANRFAELVRSVDIAGLREGDSRAIDAAWNALGLGETGWWRGWKQRW